MNFPIPVNLTVAQNNVPVNITVSDNSESIGLDIETQIVASVASEYEGPYSVTPSESVQTLETAEKSMTDDVTVGAIPADYIGSSVPRKTSADLTASGPTVTAPAGYYAEAATKSVAVGSARVYDTAIPVTPSISVDNAGKITASVSKVQSVSPSVNAGYVTTGYAGNMNVSGSAELQMTTQAAQTITPTTADQTIASGTYLTGAQTIKGDANLLAENIKKDVTIFNVVGTYEGGGGTLTTKTITQNGTYNAEDDGADGYSSVTVNVPQGVVIPSGFALYNGYLLPEVKDLGDGYDYYWIRANGQTGNFDLIRGKSQWYVSSNSGLNAWSVAFANNTTLGSHQYSIPMDANQQSTPASDWGEVTVSYAATYGTGNNRKPIFTNVDIMIQGQSSICLRHGFPVVPNLS